MKIDKKVQKLTPYDVAKINELLAGDDYPKIARHMLKGNVKLALSAQRLLMKDLRNNPQGFTKRELTLILGVTNDKVTNALKAKVVSSSSSNDDIEELDEVVQEKNILVYKNGFAYINGLVYRDDVCIGELESDGHVIEAITKVKGQPLMGTAIEVTVS